MLTCAFCEPWDPFSPPCERCLGWISEKRAQFRANVAAGKYASDGYTLDERAAKFKRSQLALFGPSFDQETGATW